MGTAEAPLKIIPGMTAVVDILTGEKTVLDYLLKPVLRAREMALRER
jgi:adhesin transport system membrane fusion protein